LTPTALDPAAVEPRPRGVRCRRGRGNRAHRALILRTGAASRDRCGSRVRVL